MPIKELGDAQHQGAPRTVGLREVLAPVQASEVLRAQGGNEQDIDRDGHLGRHEGEPRILDLARNLAKQLLGQPVEAGADQRGRDPEVLALLPQGRFGQGPTRNGTVKARIPVPYPELPKIKGRPEPALILCVFPPEAESLVNGKTAIPYRLNSPLASRV